MFAALKKLMQRPAKGLVESSTASQQEWDTFFADVDAKERCQKPNRLKRKRLEKSEINHAAEVPPAVKVKGPGTLWMLVKCTAFAMAGLVFITCCGAVGFVGYLAKAPNKVPERSANVTLATSLPVMTDPVNEHVSVSPVEVVTARKPQIYEPAEDRPGFYWVNGGYSNGKLTEGYWKPIPNYQPAQLTEVANAEYEATVNNQEANDDVDSSNFAPTRPLPSANYLEKRVWVEGYTRADGTVVDGHWRTAPKSTKPLFGGSAQSDRVWVDGYTRKDGTKVKGHWRSK